MSDDQTSEDHLHSSPQVGGEGPGLHAGRSNLAKIQGSTGSGVRYNPQTGDKLDGSTGPGKKGDQNGSPSDMNRNVTYGDGRSTPQNTSHYGNLEDRRNFSSPSNANKNHVKVGDLGNRLDESRKNPTERGFMGSVQDWGRKVAARSESGPVEKAAENFVSQPQFAAKGEKPSDKDSAAHATNLEGGGRPTAQNIANEVRNKARAGETPKSDASGSETPKSDTANSGTPKTPTENRPTRNNNPGNITWGDFARAHGATEIEGQPGKGKPRFAKFPDAATGIAAHTALIQEKYGDKTIAGMANKYAPPSENDTKKYTKDLMKGLDGVKATTKISDMTSEQQDLLLQNQRQMEGFHPRVESDGAVDKEVAQGKKQFEEKKGEPKKEEVTQPGPPGKEPAMTEVKNSGDPHTDEKLSVYKNLFL